MSDAVRMAGGLTSVADRGRVAIERLSERTTVRIAEVMLPQGIGAPLGSPPVQS